MCAIKKYLFLIVLLNASILYASTHYFSPDTIYLDSAQYIKYGNKVLKAANDTVFFLHDSIKYRISNKPFSQSEVFYDSIKERAYRNRITKELHDLVFSDNNHEPKSPSAPRKIASPFVAFGGKVIREIKFEKLDVFGPSIADTSGKAKSWLGETANSLHVKTRTYILKNNLLFEKNDPLDPVIMGNSGREIRSLHFIEDAEILVKQVTPDSVDVYVISKDLFPYGIDGDIYGFDRADLRLWNENFIGLGHSITNTVSILPDNAPLFRYDYGEYKVENINGSFIRGRLYFNRSDLRKEYGLKLTRRLIPHAIKYGGGVDLYHRQVEREINTGDSIINMMIKFDHQDYYLSRSFEVSSHHGKGFVNPFITVSSRFTQRSYLNRPYVAADSNNHFHGFTRVLGNVGFAKNDYYSSNFVFNYGRTEDIPYGYKFELIGGYEWREFYERTYTAVLLAAGKYLNNFGYLYGILQSGGFIHNSVFEDGVLNAGMHYMTDLFKAHNLKIRNFLAIDYTKGFNRTDRSKIYLNDRYGLTGYNKNLIGGQQRLFVNLQSVWFLPYSFYGFRFSVFYFAEMGLTGPVGKSIFDNSLYSGIGAGMRIKNEHLVFDALEIRFAWYPKTLPSGQFLDASFGGSMSPEFSNFIDSYPQVINYQ